MSLEVIRAGILDTIQDSGRHGYQHLGINPGGAMDQWAMKVANAVVGNEANEGIIEMSFPAASFKFHQSVNICVTGADFAAQVNGEPLQNGKLCCVPAGSQLSFTKNLTGRFVYLSVAGGLQLAPWLGSLSTNLRVGAGGIGRLLKKGDVIQLRKDNIANSRLTISSWRVEVRRETRGTIRCMPGTEWSRLTSESQRALSFDSFSVSPLSDRMGYRLEGSALVVKENMEMLSTAATFGTIQLLPNGQLIALMADHQTTGGYPRVLQVAAVDLPKLAQCNPRELVRFEIISVQEAEELYIEQRQLLRQVLTSCKAR
ncbi:MAG: biotin-dependent carboxyltransferase family protein [Flammeovirgaceae bacterium]